MTVRIDKFWIEGVLTEAYPRFLEKKGIDLDGNGIIEGNEIFGDLDGDGQVGSRGDYEIYLRKNRSPLSAKIPFLKWGEGLSISNRIHQLMYLESDLYSDAVLQSAYLFIANLAKNVNRTLGKNKLPPEKESPVYYREMKRVGIKFANKTRT